MTLELGRVTSRQPPFKYSALVRVGFSDTDAQGIVYYGRYMPYFDAAQREYLRHLGLLGSNVERERFVMRAVSVEYHAPARFDDPLEVFVRVGRIGRTSVTTAFAAHRADDGALLCTAWQTAVLVDATTGRPLPVPEAYRALVRSFEGDDLEEGATR
jgi:acyl-CoA thioester hydrolase